MKGFKVAVVLSSMLLAGGVGAQNPLDGTSTEMHSNSDMSSNGSMLAAMRSPVTGEPYEAQKVTRSVWTLADGTTITHEADSKIARDAEGRVREAVENTMSSSIGGKQIDRTTKTITIGDPVDHSIIVLTPGPAKLAMRMQLPDFAGMTKRSDGTGSDGIKAVFEDAPPPGGLVSPPPAPRITANGVNSADPAEATEIAAMRAKLRAEKDEVQTEELGTDAVDGLRVTGKRTTTTIATGKIGNDRPIVITHEEWYSPDLKMVVKSVDSDPRTGERTMVLEGLTLGDPDPALFKVPEGYKVQDMADLMKMLGGLGHPAAAKQ